MNRGVLVLELMMPRLDASMSRETRTFLKDKIQAGHRAVVLDLNKVTFVDSSGLGAIVAGFNMLRKEGGLALTGVQGAARQAFHLTRLDRQIPIYDSVSEAVSALATVTT